MARFAGESELLERLSRELREPARPLRLIIGPDLPRASPPWLTRVLRAAEEHVRRLRNDELQDEITRVRRTITDPADRYVAYRAAFDDFLGPREFDVVFQRAVLESYHSPGDGQPADAEPSGAINVESGRILELDRESWRIDAGLQALGRLVAHFPERFGDGLLTTRLDPAVEVALGQLGKDAEPALLGPGGPTRNGGVRVLHVLGFWRPLDRAQRRPQIVDYRDARLPAVAAERLRQLLAESTVCVLGVRDGDPIIVRALQAAVLDGARVLWAVPDEHGNREPRIRNLGERIGGGDSVTVYSGVDSDLLLQKLAVQLALVPGEPGAPPPVPQPRFHEQPALLRVLGAVPLRAPAESTVDLLRQLDKRFQWRLERPASPPPTLLFWPVRLREPSVIHMVQALAAAALSAHGVHVVLALDDFGDYQPAIQDLFEERVNAWFGLIPQAQRPEIVPLRSWIEEEETRQRPLRERPTRPWPVLQEYYGQRKPSVYDTLRAAKILPDEELENRPQDATQILDLLRTRSARRLLTAPAIWSLYHAKLLDRRIGEVMTLAGVDELFFWQHRQKVSGEQTRHLYHPRIDNLTQDSGLIRWDHHQDLHRAIERVMTREHWRRRGRYLPWLVENAFLLPAYLRFGGGAELAGRNFTVWPDVVAALADDPALADPLAQRISAWFLAEHD
ncbi:hypothetical protein AB0J83_11535 [Actinoplanes sp. NPDC049596]|uniref:hypothetical protein n=1 Tax=unclassified Actinoplanes TaxID=2626549 RepID=UPI0034428FB5